MATKQEYKEIIERKLSAESEENQKEAGAGDSSKQGGTGNVPITNRKEYE
jgi:hypothetical protein